MVTDPSPLEYFEVLLDGQKVFIMLHRSHQFEFSASNFLSLSCRAYLKCLVKLKECILHIETKTNFI